MNITPADVASAFGTTKATQVKTTKTYNISKVSGQDDRGDRSSGEEHVEKAGNSNSGEFRQSEQLKHLMKVKEDQQRGVVDAIKNEPASVPVHPTHGYIQGQVLQLLQEQRKHVEEGLEIMTTVEAKEKLRVCHMKFCAVQWGSGEEERLQTVTVPPHKVRMEKEKWYDSMLAEYKSLTE